MSAQVIGRIRWATCDAMPVALALAHGFLILRCPSVPLIALGLWWNANTLSHQFIHRPFFRTRLLNTIFSCYLSLLLGVPQSLWRARHLAHHRELEGRPRRPDWKLSPLDLVAVAGLWSGTLSVSPEFLFRLYVPGFLIGLGLCYLQGYYEHSRGTVSHYGRLYNFLFFNDGYHIEHHERPSANWRELPKQRAAQTNESRWPPVLRWLEIINLCSLERAVLRSHWLQRFVVQCHERAFRHLKLPNASRIAIVGGGLFPRTALILSRLMPGSTLILIDQDAGNLEIARTFLSRQQSLEGSLDSKDPALSADLRSDAKFSQAALPNHQFIHDHFVPTEPCDVDLLVVPLAFNGTREEIYRHPPAKAVLVHDWIWRQRGSSVVISFLLLKRLNLVTR
jgi:hypothetical protein